MDNLESILLNIKNKLDRLSKDSLIMYLSLDYCPSDVIKEYYNKNDSDIKLCISMNKNTPQDILKELYEDKITKYNVIENENCPREILNLLISTNDKLIYSHMMNNKKCPKKLFRMIKEVNLANEICPKDVLLKYSSNADNLTMKEISDIASNVNMTDELLNMIYRSKLGYTARYSFAKNINCSEDILGKIYEKNNAFDLKLEIIKNPHCPQTIIINELKTNNIEEYRAIASNINIPQGVLDKLSMIEDEELLFNIASNKRNKNIVLLSNSMSSRVRKGVLENESVTIDIIQSMINDIDEDISICALFKYYNYVKNSLETLEDDNLENERREERKEENNNYDLELERINDVNDKLREEQNKETMIMIKDLQQVISHVKNPDENFTIRRLHHTIPINEDFLFDVNPDGSKAIKKEFISILKYFDLSNISCNNMIATDIDFRFTNLDIDPQKVFNKDLSYSRFGDNNIHKFRSFEGVSMTGSDFSETRLSVGTSEKEKLEKLKEAASEQGADVK